MLFGLRAVKENLNAQMRWFGNLEGDVVVCYIGGLRMLGGAAGGSGFLHRWSSSHCGGSFVPASYRHSMVQRGGRT